MRFVTAAVAALCAAAVSAANNAILIPAGQSTLNVTAGSPLTIQWSNPSSSTVTIKLQQDPVTPDSGIVLASDIPASDRSATVQIPPANEVNSHLYTIEIIDDSDTSNINFSPNFGVKGATGTQTGVASTASSTGAASSSASGSTSTDSSSSSAAASSAAATSAAATSSSAATTSDSSSSSTASASASASATSSQSASSTSSSAAASQTTSVPNTNDSAAGSLKVQGGLLAMAVGLVAVL